MPKIWDGYPFSINLIHSNQNESGKRVAVSFDELDINESIITSNNLLINFEASDFGILQANFEDNTNPIDDTTRYIRINANSSGSADYETGDYNDTDYLTINTP